MSEPIYFLRLELENVRCFGEHAALDLSDGNGNWKKWTVILGDNGTGKTTLLQCIAGLEIGDSKNNNWLKSLPKVDNDYVTDGIDLFRLDNNIKLQDYLSKGKIEIRCKNKPNAVARISAYLNMEYHSLNEYQQDISFEHIPIGLYGAFKTVHKPYFESGASLHFFGYGANRFMSNKSISDSNADNSETLFNDDAKLINAEEWLLQLDYAASKDSQIKAFAIKKRDQVKQTLKDLLPDIEDIRFSTPTKENLKSTVEFKTPYGWVTIHQLSLGYKTMVAWMVDLAARMFERYPDSDNPLAEPAIVLVDEIDLHMHPKWQRKIFDYLSDKFPKTQFIVTAHSPLIVQSAPKDANIVLLRKEGDHVIIDNDIKSVHNWRIDQILSSDLFGIDARSPETEKWLEERKQLLQKDGELTDAEKQRLKELNEKARSLPTAETQDDIEAMSIIREAAAYFRGQRV